MSHTYRFHIPRVTPAAGEIALLPEEAHHALHVVRAQLGDAVVLFDGEGREIDGVVSRVTRRELFIAPSAERILPAPTTHLTIVQAWLHREKSVESLIQRGTELGVAQFLFFRAAHSEREPKPTDKWRRTAIEACKQCGRAYLPQFQIASSLRAALDTLSGTVLALTKDLDPVPWSEALATGDIAVVIGPEGDFASEELQLLRERHARPVSLGPHTFRSEVAAIIAATVILHRRGDLGPTQ